MSTKPYFRFLDSFIHASISLLMLSVFGVMCETIKPSNHAALKGQQIQLNCSTDAQWNGFWKYMKPLRRDHESWIYKGHKVLNEFAQIYRIDDSVKRHFNLIFNSSEATAGTYVCEPDVSMENSSEVIVIHGDPTCRQNTDANSVNLFCDINFSGNWSPDIEWHDSEGKVVEGNITTETIPNQRVSSSLTIPVNHIVNQRAYNISCKLMFKVEKKPHGISAQNVPELPLSCTNIVHLQTGDVASSTMTPHDEKPISENSNVVVTVVVVVIVLVLCAVTVGLALVLLRLKSRKRHKSTGKRMIETLSSKDDPRNALQEKSAGI